VQKALFCIEEIGLPYERIEAGLHFGVNKAPEYLAMNPSGLVPTLRDGDLTLWESNVIIRYLAATHSQGALWPENPRERARADMWMDWQQTALWSAMRPAFHGLVRTPGSLGPAELAAAIERTNMLFDMLERHLAIEGALACGRFTMADCAIGPNVHRWMAMPVEQRERPALANWYAALMRRSAAQKILAQPLA
jgi:glutathione S-transferase